MTAPTLLTASLLLRPYAERDRDHFVALNTDSIARRHMNGPLALDRAHALFERVLTHATAWAVVDRATGGYVGHAFINESPDGPELGFLLERRFWGRGLATEVAVRLVAHHFDEADAPRLVATVDDDHAPSIRVLEKAGFRMEEPRRADEHGPYRFYVMDRATWRGGR